MKQNPSILFHRMRNPLKNRYRGALALLAAAFLLCVASYSAAQPEYLQFFDPARGFKPAQTDLSEIFLQLAGSLEAYGSPVPYLQHVAAEHSRIESRFLKQTGKRPQSFRPDYMTDDYIARVLANWNHLSPSLGLEPFAKEFGRMMRDTIKGTRGTGTIVVSILNQHQSRVFDSMAGKATADADFKALRAVLIRELELDKSSVAEGGYEVARRDAVRCATILRENLIKLFREIDQTLPAASAEKVKKVLTGTIMDVGEMAHSELQAGISEWALSKASTATK